MELRCRSVNTTVETVFGKAENQQMIRCYVNNKKKQNSTKLNQAFSNTGFDIKSAHFHISLQYQRPENSLFFHFLPTRQRMTRIQGIFNSYLHSGLIVHD
jgi:hypothetical protein